MVTTRFRTGLRIGVGFVVSLSIVGLLLSAVGWREIAAELLVANVPLFSIGLGSVVVAFLSWSETLRRLLADSSLAAGGFRYRMAFLSGEFAKQILPLGHTAGPALMAYAVSRQGDASYEEALAATIATEFVNLGASIVLATGGMAFLLFTRPGDPVLATLAGGLVLGSTGVLSIGILVAYRREALRWLLHAVAALVERTVGRVSVAARERVAPARIDARFDSFYASLDRITTDRRQIVAAGLFALVGWGCFVLPLVTSFAALGYRIPIPIVLFVVPVVSLVNVVPLPGGLGGFELALITIVAHLTGLAVSVSTAGVLLYRVSTFWFLLLGGGLATAYLSIPLRRRSARL